MPNSPDIDDLFLQAIRLPRSRCPRCRLSRADAAAVGCSWSSRRKRNPPARAARGPGQPVSRSANSLTISRRLFAPGRVAPPRNRVRYSSSLRLASHKNPLASSATYLRNGTLGDAPQAWATTLRWRGSRRRKWAPRNVPSRISTVPPWALTHSSTTDRPMPLPGTRPLCGVRDL